MKTLIPLILAICFATVTGQTPNPTPKLPISQQEVIKILTDQVERMELKLAEMKKEGEYLSDLEKAVRETRTSQPTPRPTSYYTEYDSLRTHYPSYRYLRYSTYYPRSYSTYYPRYYPSYLYPRRAYPRYRYYPRRYLSPVRSYRRY